MFGRAICDKLPEWIFKNFEIARVKQGQFQNHEGYLSQNSPEAHMSSLVNHTKPTNTLYWNYLLTARKYKLVSG